MRDTERVIQVAIAQYLDMRRICWWAIPNGGNRNIITATKLKAEGVKSGVPDIAIVHEGQAFFLEVKKPKTDTPKGRLSDNQKIMIKRIEKAGGEVSVVYSIKDVINQLIKWEI